MRGADHLCVRERYGAYGAAGLGNTFGPVSAACPGALIEQAKRIRWRRFPEARLAAIRHEQLIHFTIAVTPPGCSGGQACSALLQGLHFGLKKLIFR